MNLVAIISIMAGGVGSGCKGPNCGRPAKDSDWHGYPVRFRNGEDKSRPSQKLRTRESEQYKISFAEDPPEYVFHGSNKENIQSIKKNGLIPARPSKAADLELFKGMSSVTTNPLEATESVYGDGTVFVFKLPEEVRNKLMVDTRGDYPSSLIIKGGLSPKYLEKVIRVNTEKDGETKKLGRAFGRWWKKHMRLRAK